MKALIQRVKQASVSVDDQNIGAIGHGVLAYIGLGHADGLQTAQRMIDKILTYRIFENDDDPAKVGKLDKNVPSWRRAFISVAIYLDGKNRQGASS